MGAAQPRRVKFAVVWKGPDALQAHAHPSHCKYTLLVYRMARKQAQDSLVLFVCLFIFLTDLWEELSMPTWVWPAPCPVQTHGP